MNIKIFTIPITDNGTAQDEMNRFLRLQKVLKIEQQFYTAPSGASWCFCVNYISKLAETDVVFKRKSKVDYKNVLSEDEFKRFTQLREVRKQIANADAVPAYAVFTDAELAEMAKSEILDSTAILSIDGIADKRFAKYGNAILEAIYAKKED